MRRCQVVAEALHDRNAGRLAFFEMRRNSSISGNPFTRDDGIWNPAHLIRGAGCYGCQCSSLTSSRGGHPDLMPTGPRARRLVLLGAEQDEFALDHVLAIEPWHEGPLRYRLAALLETMPSDPRSATVLKNLAQVALKVVTELDRGAQVQA